MRKTYLMMGFIVCSVALGWAMGGPLGAADIFERAIRGKHRMVAALLCEEPVSTFVSVMNLRGKERNRVEIRLTDGEGKQTIQTETIQRHVPLVLSCETVPPEFSQAAPIVVHVDSQFPTSGVLTHVVRGSPIQGAGSTALKSL